METPEFDKVADAYQRQHAQNVRLSGEDPSYFARHKAAQMARSLGARPAGHILDFGAGVGNCLPHLNELLRPSTLTALDVSARSLELAQARFGPLAHYLHFDGVRVPLADASVQTALAACVFHHIAADRQVPLLAELRRVLAPQGRLFIFEHNPYNPLTRYAVSTCEFDANAVLITSNTLLQRVAQAGFAQARRKYLLFFPRALRAMRPLEPWLGACPLGAQYLVEAVA